jgi:hypothetical protein
MVPRRLDGVWLCSLRFFDATQNRLLSYRICQMSLDANSLQKLVLVHCIPGLSCSSARWQHAGSLFGGDEGLDALAHPAQQRPLLVHLPVVELLGEL